MSNTPPLAPSCGVPVSCPATQLINLSQVTSHAHSVTLKALSLKGPFCENYECAVATLISGQAIP
jgi:hypothetical protein